jgi:glycosyltransferase involved in cell wall biosynthesis
VQFDLLEGRFSAGESARYSENEGDLVANFAAKILWLLDHPAERKRMGEIGRKRVEETLAWEYSIDNLLAAYRRVFNKDSKKTATLAAGVQ